MTFDFHTHTLFSDGELLPAELVRRLREVGMEGVVISDHVDHSNFEFVVENICHACQVLSKSGIRVIPGAEITHVNPDDIPALVKEVRAAGAKVVVVHGETLVEPVAQGTNEAAVKAGVDVLAHPGMIEEALVKEAARKGVLLEVTYRKGHCLSNGHVVKLALENGARLCVNSDAHSPGDIYPPEFRRKVALAAGVPASEVEKIEKDMRETFERWWKK